MSNVYAIENARLNRWADKIRTAHGQSVAGIVEVGRLLLEAKADCSHGEWGELTGRDGGKGLLPFNYRTAHRYMAIANNPTISNVTHVSHLPASWGTLAELAAIPSQILGELIASGAVHPSLERQDAIALRREHAPGSAPVPLSLKNPPAPPSDFKTVFADAVQTIDWSTIGPPLTDEERDYIAGSDARIGRMIADLAERMKTSAKAAAEIQERFPSNPEHVRAQDLGLEILAMLRQAAQAVERAGVTPLLIDAHRAQAIAFARQLIVILEDQP